MRSKPSNLKKDENRRRKRKRCKAKDWEKKLKAKTVLTNELQNTINSINTDYKPKFVIDLMKSKENHQVKGDKREKSSVKLENFLLKKETKIFISKGMLFKLKFNKNDFTDFVFTTINDIYKSDEKAGIKRKAVYFIQHI